MLKSHAFFARLISFLYSPQCFFLHTIVVEIMSASLYMLIGCGIVWASYENIYHLRSEWLAAR